MGKKYCSDQYFLSSISVLLSSHYEAKVIRGFLLFLKTHFMSLMMLIHVYKNRCIEEYLPNEFNGFQQD